jgi:hypothetical protein
MSSLAQLANVLLVTSAFDLTCNVLRDHAFVCKDDSKDDYLQIACIRGLIDTSSRLTCTTRCPYPLHLGGGCLRMERSPNSPNDQY